MKHNKKRNTAFLYECLVKELTKAIVRNDSDLKSKITEVIKENFKKGTILKKDLDIYNSLLEGTGQKEYSQVPHLEHGERIFGPRESGQYFRVPDVRDAGGLQRFLVYGPRGHGVDVPAHRQVHRFLDVLVGTPSARITDPAVL